MEFRRITVDEFDAAYALYLDVFAWLKAKGVRQWLRALPREEFAGRQARGELFALFNEREMSAIVTLAFEADTDWEKHLGLEPQWWIKTLAVTRTQRGRALGEIMIRKCESHLAATGATQVHLECVDAGFLPNYYERLGYTTLHRTDITYPSGNTFLVCLLSKPLP